MSKKLLIAYGSRAGSTAEIANKIGEVFRQQEWEVEVLPVQVVQSVKDYQAVIVGTAVRISKVLPETIRFLKRFQKDLAAKPVSFFVSCLTMFKDDDTARQETMKFVQPMLKLKEPVDLALWGGAMFPEKVDGLWAVVMRKAERADYRNWDKITDWANEQAEKLSA